jgi:hypothetical protein
VGTGLFHADGQTDRHNEGNSSFFFSKFVNAPKNYAAERNWNFCENNFQELYLYFLVKEKFPLLRSFRVPTAETPGGHLCVCVETP